MQKQLTTKYLIKTPSGWSNFNGIQQIKKHKSDIITLFFDNNKKITVTKNHLLKTPSGFKESEKIIIGDVVFSDSGVAKCIRISNHNLNENVYDLLEVEKNNEYYTNDLISHNCSFMGSTDNLISSNALHNLFDKKPITDASGLKQYEKPLPDKLYALVADVSRGKGLDYSAFSVIDVSQMPYKQVCIYNNNEVGPIDYATIIHNIAKLYNNAMVLVEINDIGGQVADVLALDFGYDNLLSTQTNGRSGKRISGGFGRNTEKGIRTSAKVKLIGCAVLKMMIEQEQLLIHDLTTIEQLKRFIKKGDSYEAERGSNDDLVMTLVLFAWLADQSYFREMTDINTLRRLRDNTDEEIDNLSLNFFYTSREDEFSTWSDF